MVNSDVVVSVFCLTYNHEQFIEKCLQGFVMQKTNFKFEVLVHDDASTDNTAAIVSDYAVRYPNIIKPILQKENQYSKGQGITRTILLPLAKGEYLAWCEGDDYWTDEYKLQKQYDFLNNNKDYSLCVHRTAFKYLRYNYERIVPESPKEKDWTVEDIIKYGGGCFATNSLMIKKSVYMAQPACFRVKGFADFQMFIFGALNGKCRCLSDVMSVYNHGTPNSYSERNRKNKEKQIESLLEFIKLYRKIDNYTLYKYTKVIQEKIIALECDIYIMQGKKEFSKREPYKYIWAKHRLKYYLKNVKEKLPIIVKMKYVIKGTVNKIRGNEV